MLTEWGMNPVEIIDTWTDEMMNLMLDKLIERKNREAKAWESSSTSKPEPKFVSIDEFVHKLAKES